MISLKRIVGLVAGAAPIVTSLLGHTPPWVGLVGGLVMGSAINAEKLFAKRAAGAPTFNTLEAEAKVARIKP